MASSASRDITSSNGGVMVMEESSQQTSEESLVADESDKVPVHARLWFKRTALFLAVVVMLMLLGLLFSPRYWRF